MSPLTEILVNLYGEDFRIDFEEHLALLKEINVYNRRKRAEIELQSIEDYYNLKVDLLDIYSGPHYDYDVMYFPSYFGWFKDVFIEDYDRALMEIFLKDIPSDRELCILRLAREAAYKNIANKTMSKFCREYLTNAEEYTLFWPEYYNTRIDMFK